MISAIIVDDEQKSRKTLTKMVEKYCPSIQLIGQAASAQEAYEFIIDKEPELVFLDIEMPHGSGFDLLKRFDKIKFGVIFTTAYDQYALNAIKFCALDYLLKPIDIQELIKAVEKAENNKKSTKSTSSERFHYLIENLSNQDSKSNKVGIPTQEGLEFIIIGDVIRCEADGSYTKLFLKGKRMIIATGPIKEFEEIFVDYRFIRVHHSHLINLACIYKYIKGEGGTAVMDDGTEVPISRRRKDMFLNQLQTL